MKGGVEMKLNKRAQSEIITTVLIILLVLAAIIIVWQVIQGTVKDTTTEVGKQASCIGINLEIVKANSTTDVVSVTRKPGADSATISSLKFIVGGTVDSAVTTNPAIGILETKDYSAVESTAGQTVEVAPVLSDGTTCSVAATATAAD